LGYTILVAAACIRAGNITWTLLVYIVHCHCQIPVPL
jgi:hypothetical protein